MNPKDIVRNGYDKVSYAYQGDEIDDGYASQFSCLEDVKQLIRLLPPGSAVLDLGCGCGIPTARFFADNGFRLTGVDISPVQIRRARKLVPNAVFLCEDMVQLDLPAASFDVVVSLYSIIHVPLPEQPGLFANVRRWLKDGGYFLVTVGGDSWTGTEADWLNVKGANMYWSHTDKDSYQQMLIEHGFTILWDRFIAEGDAGHVLMLAQAAEFSTGRAV